MSTNLPADRARELGRENNFLTLCRIGFLGRGVLYVLVAVLVLRTGRTEDLTGALAYLNEGSGRLLVLGIAAGMLAYGLWRLADAAFGMEHPGEDTKALILRAGAGLAGSIYLYLSYKAVTLLLAGQSALRSPEQQADTVLDLPGGHLALGLAALVLLAAGANQLRRAFSCSFLSRLDDRAKAPLVKWLGRIGYAARGVIFLIVAAMIGRAAIDGRSDEVGGMEQALDFLSGPTLYAVALGLLLFGAFSFVEAAFRQIHAPPAGELKQLGDRLSG